MEEKEGGERKEKMKSGEGERGKEKKVVWLVLSHFHVWRPNFKLRSDLLKVLK